MNRRRGKRNNYRHNSGGQGNYSHLSLNKSYESNGPTGKVKGTAQIVYDKYLSLARDAQSSGDRILAENYLQHAEHYLRIIHAIQDHMMNVQQENAAQNPQKEDTPDTPSPEEDDNSNDKVTPPAEEVAKSPSPRTESLRTPFSRRKSRSPAKEVNENDEKTTSEVKEQPAAEEKPKRIVKRRRVVKKDTLSEEIKEPSSDNAAKEASPKKDDES